MIKQRPLSALFKRNGEVVKNEECEKKPENNTNDPYKYITDNIPKLEEWSGHKYGSILYDSDKNKLDYVGFANMLAYHKQ